jgi:hypothetical protein
MAQATARKRPGEATAIKSLGVTMRTNIKNIALGAIVLFLFGILTGQVVFAEEATVVFGVA